MAGMNLDRRRLLQAQAIALNVESTNQQRLEAYHLIEVYKQNPSRCLALGSCLIICSEPDLHRILGFDLINAFISEGWADANERLKFKCKSDIVNYISDGLKGFVNEPKQVKEKLANVVCEMIKHDFPQKWPSIFHELFEIAKIGPLQTDVVFKICLRVSEEVIQFQRLIAKRIKDIKQGFYEAHVFKPLVALISETLRAAVEVYYSMLNSEGSTEGFQFEDTIQRHLALSALECMCGFIGWTPYELLFETTVLMETLCLLLTVKCLRMMSAECLITLLSRKTGPCRERAPMLSMFCPSVLDYLHNSTRMVLSEGQDEQAYLFLKRLFEILARLGEQYIILARSNELGSLTDRDFEHYFLLLFLFGEHHSQYFTSWTLETIISFLRNIDRGVHASVFARYLKKIFNITLKTLMKIGYPSKDNHPSCFYSRIDFDNDQAYSNNISHCRSIGCDSIKKLSEQYMEEIFRLLYVRAVDVIDALYMKMCDYEAKARFEAMSLLMSNVINKMNASEKLPFNYNSKCNQLLSKCLTYAEHEMSPLILNSLLSEISCLFHVWSDQSAVFIRVLQLIFRCLNLRDSSQPYKAIQTVHRHASSLLLGKVAAHTEAFLFLYDDLQPAMLEFIENEENDNNCRASTLETMVSLTTQLEEPRRSEIFEKIISLSASFTETEEYQRVTSDPSKFAEFMQLTGNISTIYPTSIRKLRFVTMGMNGFLRRVKITQDNMCPGYKLIDRYIDSLFALLRSVHGLHTPTAMATFSKDYALALQVPESERENLLGINQGRAEDENSRERDPLEKKQLFLRDTHTNCIQFICSCVKKLVHQLAVNRSALDKILDAVFDNFDVISNSYLANIINFFIKPLHDKIPQEYNLTIFMPILRRFFINIFPRFLRDWTNLKERLKEKHIGEEMEEELTEDLFLRRNTKDILIIIEGMMLQPLKPSQFKDELVAQVVSDFNPVKQSHAEREPKPTGELIIADDEMYQSVLLILFNCVLWPDTTNCCRAALITWPVFKYSLERNPGPEAVGTLFTQVIRGLQVNGSEENGVSTLINLVVLFYEKLRIHYPILRDIMLQVPEIDVKVLDLFERSMFAPDPDDEPMLCKSKRDGMKVLLKGVIARPVSMLYQQKSKFLDLPPVIKVKKEQYTPSSPPNLATFFADA